MSFTITNQIAAPVLDGQDALVTLTWAASTANLANISIGEKVTTSGGNIGYVSFIDPNGIYVKVKPQQPNLRFDSASSPGILAATEVLTFN
jgi:hypothetical protein